MSNIEFENFIYGSNTFNELFQTKNIKDIFTKGTYPYDVKMYDDGAFEIVFALSGWKRDEINIKVLGDTLTISGNKQEVDLEEPVKYLHRGIARRNFSQKFILGAQLDRSKINSSFINGELIISIPVSEKESFEVTIK